MAEQVLEVTVEKTPGVPVVVMVESYVIAAMIIKATNAAPGVATRLANDVCRYVADCVRDSQSLQ